MRAIFITFLIALMQTFWGAIFSTAANATDVSCIGTNQLNAYNRETSQANEQPFIRITPTECEHIDEGATTPLSSIATTDSPVLAETVVASGALDYMHIHWKSGGNITSLTVNNTAIAANTDVELFGTFGGTTTYAVRYEHATAGIREFTFQLETDQKEFKEVTFTVTTPDPVINTIAPVSTTLGGGNVVITGENFTAASAVKFDGVDVASFTVDSSTQITATVPPRNIPGTVDVSVTNPGGTTTRANFFTYTAGVPTLTSVSPGSGSKAGGTAIIITGTNLTGATAVTIGGATATSVVIVNDSQITAVTPAGAIGPANVQITAPGGVVLAKGLIYVLDPSLILCYKGSINGAKL